MAEASAESRFKLDPAALAPEVDPTSFGFLDTRELEPLAGPIGQERALEALDFGLSMRDTGFNVFASGPVGTGKWTIVMERVKAIAAGRTAPRDWCYVHNVQDPSRPRCLAFPAGQGRAFRGGIEALIDMLKRELPVAFESSKYIEGRARLLEEFTARKKAEFRAVAELARSRGFGFEEEPIGFSLFPLKDGRPMTDEERAALSETERADFAARLKEIEGRIRELQSNVHAIDHEAERTLRDLDRGVVRQLTRSRLDAMRQIYTALPDVLDFLTQLATDIEQSYRDFLKRESAQIMPGLELPGKQADLSRYQVNLVVEHAADGGAPVVEEPHPTYANVIGKIERRSQFGVVYSELGDIKAGACARANGGFLVLNAMEVLRQPFAWEALRRVIKTRELVIEDPSEFVGFSTSSLRPQPMPVELKVVLLGPPMLYQLLLAYDEEFHKIFKVKADFEPDVPRTAEHDLEYARWVARVVKEESLPHFDAPGIAALVRHAMRLAERNDRLSLRLNLLADVVREAAFWARQAGHERVGAADVDAAIARKRRRSGFPEQWVQDEIQEGTLMVDVAGAVVGQVNGLSVHLLGDIAFGRPSRITARTYVGTKGVIDIQREADLAGSIHSKGVMTLAGYLAGRFAGTHPFALTATLTFEQAYSEVEGDSAACAELAAVLSSLAEVPIRQSLAITGSVNQLGEVQPIGGANEKIEGFFETCRRQGLTGEQGVILPRRNVRHLGLRADVVEAVRAGQFSIYAVERVEEALELLTGLPAGERRADGSYPEGTLYAKVAARLDELAKIVMRERDKAVGAAGEAKP
ncbi:MAG: AAA family ATPase [bacterium]